jgi:hypothetical protein
MELLVEMGMVAAIVGYSDRNVTDEFVADNALGIGTLLEQTVLNDNITDPIVVQFASAAIAGLCAGSHMGIQDIVKNAVARGVICAEKLHQLNDARKKANND